MPDTVSKSISVSGIRDSGGLPIKFLCDTLPHMSIRAGVVVAVTFEEVDDTPDAETSAESDNKGLKNGDSLIEKCHKLKLAGII